MNESAKNSTKDEVSEGPEDETDNEEECKNNGEFNWSDIDFEEMYNDREQMKKLIEYDEECKNSKFVVVETAIESPDRKTYYLQPPEPHEDYDADPSGLL